MRRMLPLVALALVAGLPTTSRAVDADLGLSFSEREVDYRDRVTVTVHLDVFEDTANRDVSIFRTPWGDEEELFRTGELDQDGNFSVEVVSRMRTTYVARWSGDQTYGPAVSPERELLVHVVLRGALGGSYGSSGRYLLFHQGDDPVYRAKVLPDHSGDRVTMTIQRLVGSEWETAARRQVSIDDTNRATLRLVDFPRSRYRIRSQFRYDGDHLGDRSPWTYFRIA